MPKKKKVDYLMVTVSLLLLYGLIMGMTAAGVLTRYNRTVLNTVLINIIMATSLNITVGCLGQVTLGQAGFMSIGAYAAALFMKAHWLTGGLGYVVSLALGGLLAGFFGLVVGLPVLRLKGDYLAMVTLAFGEIVRVVIENLGVTGGAQGVAGIPTMKNFSVIFLITVLCVSAMYALMTSRHGRAVLAIRDNELAADSSGINPTYYKTFAFTASAFFAGIAGAIYAQNMGVISADVFNYNASFQFLTMVVLGGMGSFTGSVLAAVVLTVLPEALRVFADWRMVIMSVILILVMLFRPQGLMGRKEFQLTDWLRHVWSRDRKKEVEDV